MRGQIVLRVVQHRSLQRGGAAVALVPLRMLLDGVVLVVVLLLKRNQKKREPRYPGRREKKTQPWFPARRDSS